MSDNVLKCINCQRNDFLIVLCERCLFYYCFKCWETQTCKKECLYRKSERCEGFHVNRCDVCTQKDTEGLVSHDDEQMEAFGRYLDGLEKTLKDRKVLIDTDKEKEKDISDIV